MSTQCCSVEDQKDVTTNVKDYYGKTLSSTSDLKTNACTINTKKIPKEVKEALSLIHEEVRNKYYGCGLVAPECLLGTHILDLGCGAGQDCYVLSQLVGESGSVTGLDMTDEQLEIARKYIDYQADKFGFTKPNTKFIKGYLENLNEAGFESDSFDIIVSNCVINLVADKKIVLQEAFRVLKNGGELHFSDVYSDRILSDEIRRHTVLWGECISGALFWKQLADLAHEIGFCQPCLVSSVTISVGNPELQAILGDANFVSATYRLFKCTEKKIKSTQVIYEGEISHSEDIFTFDIHNQFPAGEPIHVTSEIASILKSSRFSDEFTFNPSSSSRDSSSMDDEQTSIDYDAINPFKIVSKSAPDGSSCCSSNKCC